MSFPVMGVRLTVLLLVGGAIWLPSIPSSLAQAPREAVSLTRQFKFSDEKEIKQDWKLTGEWRVEGQGVRLYADKTTELGSNYKVKGDLELTIVYEINPKRELCVSLWGEQFDFKQSDTKKKGNVVSMANLVRKGDTVVFRTGKEKGTTVKLQESRRDLATPIVIFLDRKTTSKTTREYLIRSISIKAAQTERSAD